MSAADKIDSATSFFSSGSLWGGLAGVLLGLGVAVGVTAGPIAFPLIILGSAAMGVAFGNAVGSILSGDKGYRHSTSPARNLSGGELEQSHELIDHLRLREDQHKNQIESETAKLRRVGPSPVLQPAGGPSSSHFQNMLQNQRPGQIQR